MAPTHISSRQLFQAHLAQTSDSPIGIEAVRAAGSYIFDTDGKAYLDLISGISVSNIGHCHPRVVQAVQQQASEFMHLMVYGEYVQSPQVRLAEKIAQITPTPLSSVYLVNSGSEAIEGALKLAKKHTGRTEMIACHQAYHGSTHGALSMMGDPFFRDPFGPLLPEVKHIAFNDLSSLDQITGKTACILLETVQGEAGVRLPETEYLAALQARCDEVGALLILDEVQCGFGRTGSWFAFDNEGIVPDILVLAKGMGGGMPIGAFVSSPKIMQSLQADPPLGHITTFGGHPVSCAASLANIAVIESENLIEQVADKAQLFVEQLQHPRVKEIRHRGLLMAIDFGDQVVNHRVIDQCIENGVITDWFLFNEQSMRIAPPLTISEEEIDNACEVIRAAMDGV